MWHRNRMGEWIAKVRPPHDSQCLMRGRAVPPHTSPHVDQMPTFVCPTPYKRYEIVWSVSWLFGGSDRQETNKNRRFFRREWLKLYNATKPMKLPVGNRRCFGLISNKWVQKYITFAASLTMRRSDTTSNQLRRGRCYKADTQNLPIGQHEAFQVCPNLREG